MSNQQFSYLSRFASGPSSGTRSQRAHAARVPTSLPTIPESDEESDSNQSQQPRLSSPQRLRRSQRLAPIFDSDEDSEVVEDEASFVPPHYPYSQPPSSFRADPVAQTDNDGEMNSVEDAPLGEGADADLSVIGPTPMDEDDLIQSIMHTISLDAPVARDRDIDMEGENIGSSGASGSSSSTPRKLPDRALSCSTPRTPSQQVVSGSSSCSPLQPAVSSLAPPRQPGLGSVRPTVAAQPDPLMPALPLARAQRCASGLSGGISGTFCSCRTYSVEQRISAPHTR